MKIDQVYAMYFSATGTTRRSVLHAAQTLAQKLGVPLREYDFTLPQMRQSFPDFGPQDFVFFALPVYAGRVPNLLRNYVCSVRAAQSPAAALVSYGNRNYDDALVELHDILCEGGFYVTASAAIVGEHAFSTTLAAGRPDAQDMEVANKFASDVAAKLEALEEVAEIIAVEGVEKPYRGYYQPRDRKGTPINILKVKPLTNDNCVNCGLCAKVCPMGSINPENVKEVVGICIKCCACVKKCPMGAKYYEDAGYLYHQTELEEGYARRAEPALFI